MNDNGDEHKKQKQPITNKTKQKQTKNKQTKNKETKKHTNKRNQTEK